MNNTQKMSSAEIRRRFLSFFEKRGHTVIPSASLVTTDEKGITNPTLFNTAGMQPLIPYLLGKPYFINDVDGAKNRKELRRLVDVQKCLRTIDIDEIGDKTHATFFEMLGNWSLGGAPEGYFKKEAISWSYEFLTSTSDESGNEGLGLDPSRLYVTVFEGDKNSGKDTESADIWKSVGVPENRIYYKDASANWWPAVKSDAKKEDNWTGPTGPCSEMFYDITDGVGLGDLSPEEFQKADDEQKVVEIWNDVFIEFEKVEGKIVGKLAKNNVDTGAGFERLAMVMQGVDNIYDTDLFISIMDKVRAVSMASSKPDSQDFNLRSARIVSNHIKSAVFMIADGVIPSNTDRGYVLRKLIRRAVRHADILGITGDLIKVAEVVQDQYKKFYPNVAGGDAHLYIQKVIRDEEIKFQETLKNGLTEFEKISAKNKSISAHDAFALFSSYGFPLDLTVELAKEKGIEVDTVGFEEEMKKHQDLSRTGAEKKFKGGLADANDPTVVRYHTATHLLHQALHDVLGDSVSQKGSNITPERLRFDFAHAAKMTDDEKKRVEDIVNKKIAEALPVQQVVMPKAEAEKTGARHFFGDKYGDEVSIYFVGSDLTSAYSKEFCGGPHVKNTRELAGPDGKAHFKIQKEEAVSQGVRRIKAVLA